MYEEYGRKGYWGPETPSDIWIRNAKEHPDKEALVDSKNRLTWQEANRWIDRLALCFLELGIKRDELIVVQLPNSVELCLLRVACERAGILCLPLWRTWRHREMAYALERVEAAAVVIPWQFREFDHFEMIQEIRPGLPKLRHVFVAGDEVPEGAISIKEIVLKPLEERYPRDYLDGVRCKAEEFSLVLPTTGTTGFPKFVENPVCSFMCREKACVEDLKITSEDILAGLTPAGGGSNGRVYLGAPLAVAKIAMLEHFSPPEALELMEKERVTIAPMVPAQAAMMIRHPDFEKFDTRSLRLVLTMGAPLPFDVAVEVEEKLGCIIVQNYSSIDCGAACLGSIHDPPEVRLRTVGKPYAGAEVRLVSDRGEETAKDEAGEILLRGPGAVSGYYRDPEATRQVWTRDGWYKTGDLGRLDDQGHLIIVGRKKDMIIRGGQNIYPVEIENLLMTHPKISSAAIVKMPDPVMGERACAYIVPEKDQEFSLENMVSFLKHKGISAYKWPERLEVIDEMPMVAEGQKIDKKVLEKDIGEKLRLQGNLS
jgi:non-ribosomal peptide synthetase component E (peptide arylation enzyme)